ncbi:MAG TPA: hydantoinase/oxoprolinase N-terminal domain-containing protein, partial [Candidatus Binatus sp.]|nr:hydantoinase/oxoprolinase N-terminal domain-containing protein [Candidatus Binatus sp.]
MTEGLVRVAVDIGGTFTDLVSMDAKGKISNIKVLTTPFDPAKGLLEALDKLFQSKGITPADVRLIVHATTLASNALLTGKIPKVCLVTTNGFRDVLEIGRQNRPELYNLQVDRPRPLVPRRLRFEVDERTTFDGTIIKRLNTVDSERVARRIRTSGAQSVAVSFLHAYAN